MKVPSHAIDAYARKALSSTQRARPVEPSATRALASSAGAGMEEQKLAALKKRISDGEYRVNPQTLAMRLLDSLG